MVEADDLRVAPPGPRSGVVVAGAASGMGRATCVALAEWGRPFSAWDIDGAGAKEVAAECASRFGVTTDAREVDLADPEQIAAAVPPSIEAVGGVGGLCLAAGVNKVTGFEDVQATWSWHLDVNTRSFSILVEQLLPELRRHAPSAAIVAIASINGIIGHSFSPAYCASKGGLIMLAKSYAHGLAREGIRVNAVCPGDTLTSLWRAGIRESGFDPDDDAFRTAVAATVPLQKIADPAELARPVRFLLSDDASYITATTLVVDGGRTGVGPGVLTHEEQSA